MPARKYFDPVHHFQVRIPKELWDRLECRAREEGKSINDLLVEMVTRSMKADQRRKKRT